MLENALKCAALGLILLSIGAVVAMAAPSAPGQSAPTSASLDRFRSLAGEWVAAEDGEMFKKGDVVARYAVTAAGSAVVGLPRQRA